MGDVAVAHASAPPLTVPGLDAAALDANAAAANNAGATTTNAAAIPSERFSPGGHALRARARAVNYNLKKSDFGGTPAWLKASSAAPDGGLAHGGGRAEKGVTSSKVPTAAANASKAGTGRFSAAAKGKAPVFSIHARAAGEENAAAAVPAPPQQRAPRARPHGLEFSRAALNNAGADNAPHPAGRGGAASTSQAASSGRDAAPLINRASKPAAVAGAKKRGRPPANNNANNHEVHWGSAPSPHRSFVSGGANSPSRAAYASMLGYEQSPPQHQRARGNNGGARFNSGAGGGNNEATAAAAVAASAAAAGVLRKVQDEYNSLIEKYQRLKDRRLVDVEELIDDHDAKVEAHVESASRLAENWRAEAERQGARAAGAAATREELGKSYEALAAARSHAHELEARALAAEEEVAELRRELAAARLALEARPRADKGCQASLLVMPPVPQQQQQMLPQQQQQMPMQQGGGFYNGQQQGNNNRGLAAAWCPEGDVASSALYLPPPQQQQQRRNAPVAAAAAAGAAPPAAPQQQQQQPQNHHQELTAALGLVTGPGRTRPGATLYFHAATGLRFEAAPTGGGGVSGRPGEVLYSPLELGALATSLPVYMRQEVALSARDWPAFYGKVLQAVGAGAKAAARAKATVAQQG